jgi:formate dehydrogenase iron-sulfur subunit
MSGSLLQDSRVPASMAPTAGVNGRPGSAHGSATDDLGTVVDRLLREQSELTAVERFSQLVEASSEPLQARYYRALLPATPPGPGEQYAFEVDLDRCSGCKACVTACHNLNGLDDDETWRDVGLLHGVTSSTAAASTIVAASGATSSTAVPLLQHVTTACHHCVEPGCLAACPTVAYEKDPETGIVKHLDDQCFGCQYCTLACPYGVPKYHAAKGIVRKCDLCSSRLKVGEAPACVQACPHEAIRVRSVSRASATQRARQGLFLPASPAPHHTTPTTVYTTDRLDLRHARAADEMALEPDHAHPPLVLMLVLTQFAVGLFAIDAILCLAGMGVDGRGLGLIGRLVAFAVANAGLACATLHLGRPWLAFRAVLGWRTSWLSREALVFGLFVKFAVLQLAVETLLPSWWSPALGAASALAGLAGVWCSIKIYAICPRPLWNLPATTARFGATTLGLGCAGTNAVFAILPVAPDRIPVGTSAALSTCLIAGGSLLVWRLLEDFALVHAPSKSPEWKLRAHRLRTGPLSSVGTARVVLCLAGYVTLATGCLLAGAGWGTLGMVLAVTGLATRVAGELCERWLFFAGSTTPQMPGGVTA